MKRNISLYINGQLVDVDSSTFILFNYAMDDLQNPAIVKNSYSQQVTLPGTATNNRLFEEIYRLDRTTGTGFNPLNKTSFEIYDDANSILESGYMKLDKINRECNTIVSYSVSLYGGLGGFFYGLMYNDDGSKKTLADMLYDFPGNPGSPIDPYEDTMRLTKVDVQNAWNSLAGSADTGFYRFINYAPCYNGFPGCSFDANKAIYKMQSGAGTYPNLYKSKDGYGTRSGANGAVLLEMDNKHTEWELQDLRSYLQRPVIRLKHLLNAFTIQNNTGNYTFILDGDFFNSSNNWYEKGWMTLAMFDRDNVNPAQFQLSELLKSTESPADYLIGFAKMFGLVFLVDAATNTITLTGRNKIYSNSSLVDLSERIDTSVNISPYMMDAKYYVWGNTNYGEFASEYKAKYGKEYGSKTINTGYDFNADSSDVLSGVAYKGAADVLESNAMFQVFGALADDTTGSFVNYMFKVPFFEGVKWTLYKMGTDGKEETLACEPDNAKLNPVHYSLNTANYNDFFAKVQLHGKDNAAENGANVLLFFEGMKNTPEDVVAGVTISQVLFHLSDDTQEMLLLNGGKPCWDVSPAGDNALVVYSIPQFRRWHLSAQGELLNTWDMGDALETAVPDPLVLNKGLYNNFWAAYISDRYNVDTKVITRKVDLSGMQVDFNLLRKFYWFENSIWVLNRISNHSLTTWDMTECEFIKVGEQYNYVHGQLDF